MVWTIKWSSINNIMSTGQIVVRLQFLNREEEGDLISWWHLKSYFKKVRECYFKKLFQEGKRLMDRWEKVLQAKEKANSDAVKCLIICWMFWRKGQSVITKCALESVVWAKTYVKSYNLSLYENGWKDIIMCAMKQRISPYNVHTLF